MSFGFSVGDIILVSQLSYKLYETLTSGRRNASRELEELESVLFGLRCALNHLRHVANKILTAAASPATSDNSAQGTREALDQMIQNCATTLEDLDSATKPYRDGAKQVVEDGEVDNIGPSQKRRRRWKRNIASNWMKVRWDMDKDSLKMYRDKLQSHIDNINLVLNTFLWSATEKIHADGTIHAEKMHEYHNKILKSNSSLEFLVERIHSMLLDSKPTAPASFPMYPNDVYDDLSSEPVETTIFGAPGDISTGIKSVAAHYAPYGPYPMVNLASTSLNLAHTTRPHALFGGAVNPHIPALANAKSKRHRLPVKAGGVPRELPPKIVSINIKRQSQGAKALVSYKESLQSNPRPQFLEPRIPDVAQLGEGLEYIFTPLPRSTANQLEIAKKTRAQDIGTWFQAFDHLLSSVATSSSQSSGDGSESAVSAQRSALIELLVKMNECIERSNQSLRSIFYDSSATARVDQVLDKFLSLTRSVRGQKEVEEFMDEREDWRMEH